MGDVAEILDEADAFFMGKGRLHDAASRLGAILDEMGIPYVVAGAIALAAHGRRRLTERIAILVAADGLAAFKAQWLGKGYVEVTPGLKAVRDTHTGVKIDFLLAGDFPGDGKPKPIAFPTPPSAAQDAGDFRVLELERLVELELASGMTAPHRAQDLVDVMELVRARSLPADFRERLHPYVRAEFDRQWHLAQVSDDY